MTAPLHIEYATIIQKDVAREERFKLVEIAFKQLLIDGRAALAERTVKLADDVLSAMEKADDLKEAKAAQRDFALRDVIAGKKPDAGASAGVETPVTAAAIIPLIRQRLQNELADERAIHERHPAQDETMTIQQFREGAEHGLRRAIAIVAEMEKPGEVEDDDTKG